MNHSRRLALLALPLFLLVPSAPARADGGADEVLADAVAAHVRFLAADALEGRSTGTREALLAARYLATELERAGLTPAGDDGGYLQTVPLRRLVAHGTPLVRAGCEDGARVFAHGEDFTIRERPGASARELRIATVPKSGPLPDPDPGLALDFDGSRRAAQRMLEDAGRPNGEGYGLVLLRGRDSRGRPRGPVREALRRGAPAPPEAPAWIDARGPLHTALEEGRVRTISFDGACAWETVPAANVVARIPGVGTPERPELAREAVVLTAHYDHIGTVPADRDAPTGADGEPDRVFNGADDDASGVACVLEVARALASGPPPAREVVVLLVTGEERGLLGTEHYLDHPLVPLERTACNLNVEMVGRPDAKAGGSGIVWFTGPDKTNLLDAFRAAQLPVVADPYPEMNYYVRSDNIAFVRRGVIGQTFSTYDGHGDYHRVTDEPDTLDWDHLAAATAAVTDAVRLVTSGAADPRWAEGAADGDDSGEGR